MERRDTAMCAADNRIHMVRLIVPSGKPCKVSYLVSGTFGGRRASSIRTPSASAGLALCIDRGPANSRPSRDCRARDRPSLALRVRNDSSRKLARTLSYLVTHRGPVPALRISIFNLWCRFPTDVNTGAKPLQLFLNGVSDDPTRSSVCYGLCHSAHPVHSGAASNRPATCAARTDCHWAERQISPSEDSPIRPTVCAPLKS